MGRTKPSASRKQSVGDSDTMEVKRERSVDATLAQEMGSATFAKLKHDDSTSASRSPSANSMHLKTSRSPSISSLPASRPSVDETEVKPKSEELNGHLSPVKPQSTKTKVGRSASAKGPPPRIAPLFDHLPDVKAEATSSFKVIESSTYQNKYLGLTESALECDCSEEWNSTTRKNNACGEHSDCINRATKMECPPDDCTCGAKCQNQRFTRRLYADVSVIQTDKKGHGLRTNTNLKPGDFIFEYIGEVIAEQAFHRRMRVYDQEGIKHFYFMSLSKGEFVDATKKGNLGRFCNHSCNPNCYVDKWVIGDKLRMGIFAERHIKAGEELVFNYNVDRYGANPQPCYCGESNCTGFIGGKTQTEKGTKLSAATIEALGLEDDIDDWDTVVAKKPKKKKTAEDDDQDYVESVQVRALDADGVTKVMAALMQCKEKWIAVKLLQRIQTTEDELVRHRIVRLHGYRILNSQLAAWKDDENIILQILEILDQLPRLTRNKIVDSRLDQTLQSLERHNDEKVALRAASLNEAYSQLELAYRIPRKKRDDASTPTKVEANPFERRENVPQRRRSRSRSKTPPRGPSTTNVPSGPRALRPGAFAPRPPIFPRGPPPLPRGWFSAQDNNRTYYYSASGQTSWVRPTQPADQPPPPPKQPSGQDVLKNIIDNIVTAKDKEPKSTAPEESDQSKKEKKGDRWKSYDEDKLKKLYENTLYPHISHVMNKYKHKIPKEDLKRFGKEIAKKLVASDYKSGRVKDPTKIDEKQQKKVKDYCKQFFDKAAHKHKKHEDERATRKANKGGDIATPSAMSPSTDQNVSPNIKKEESDDDEDIKMSDHELENGPTPDTPSESNALKRKRSNSSPVVKDEIDNSSLVVKDEIDDPTKSPLKKLNTETPPPPPPPPAPPMETPPANTPTVDMDVEADLNDEGDTMFKDKSMADVRALAQQMGDDEEMVDGYGQGFTIKGRAKG